MKLTVLFSLCLAAPAFSAYGNQGGYQGPLASPVINPNGFLADTPAVAAAKAAHYAEVSKVGNAPAPAYNAPAPSYNAPAPAYNAPAPAYNAAPAQTYNAPNYYTAPEQPAPVYESAPASGRPYTGPPAKISVSPAGFIVDTPEVAAEKAAHFSLVAKAQSAQKNVGPAEQHDDGSYKPDAYNDAPQYSAPAPQYSAPAPQYSAPSYSAPAPQYSAPSYSAPAPQYSAPAPQYSAPAPNGGYRGPQASPVVNPNGFLVDTPEVAAAKAAHFSEFSKNQGHGQARYRRGLYLAPHRGCNARVHG